ncbi:MAG: FAD-dependent oxidoreductase [Deltaproteobacteria bacterium]|nr:FAD-dependent oxidoreductase [Deltaproteobacteria bacterium]MBW2693609.1 FAD-dependent oxidoreductase [Deltaproteobacteria bacterium]
MSNPTPSHCMAVIGGAVAGAEVAATLAEKGVEVVVIEQNSRPYGKIEDGLPRWHHALRQKEYATIRGHLARPGVHFVPLTRVGRDIDFRELVEAWGFSGVVLANGAWRDRAIPLEGADAYVDKGLVYQNPFIIWFNHAEEASYDGPRYETPDGALVIGGGLASIDVAKALMLETARVALKQRGIEVPVLELEVKGIPKALAAHDLAFEDLGLAGCTLFYRRRGDDMPLVEIPDGATPERTEKVRNSRRKLLQKAMDKYRFSFEPLCMPDGLLVEDGRLAGFRFRRTRMEAGRPVPTDETFERRGPLTVSSIGSIPQPIEGIALEGELFAFSDWDLGRLADYPTVFSAGNVATGKGNIIASRKHARLVSETISTAFLGLGDDGHAGEEAALDATTSAARETAHEIAAEIKQQPPITPETLAALRERVRARQQTVGYDGNFETWITANTPEDFA